MLLLIFILFFLVFFSYVFYVIFFNKHKKDGDIIHNNPYFVDQPIVDIVLEVFQKIKNFFKN